MPLTRTKPMQRTGIKAKAPARAQRREREPGEFDSFRLKPTTEAVMAERLAERPPAKVAQKTPEPWDKRIREAARDEECSIRIAGVCNFRTDTTVWCHLPGIAGGRGMGFKAIDLCGAFGCVACHDVVDGRAPFPPGANRATVMLDFFYGHMRSLVILKQKGLA